MFFKTMEIQGFKSFPDKTVLNFDTKMTAIVGSNGNGKSNISDALRWVMGEQGAKTLRGDKMEDVIFHGTVSRKPMGFARVALTIDNSDRALAVDADEVVIARKLYRTGDSEYLINSDKVRLKDIHELLMGTGLGRDGYSIIGQGRVAEVINAKGSQRRELFEEAAGVSKFLHRKNEAERDLVKANDNILRLKDITTELEGRIPVLERQSEKARKARVLMEEEKSLEISVSVFDLEAIGKDILETEDKILLNEGQCEHFEREIAELEEENERLDEEKLTLRARSDELMRDSDSAKDRISQNERDIAVLENEITHNDGRIVQINEQIEASAKGSEEIDERIPGLEADIEKKREEIATAEKSKEEITLRLSELSEKNSELDENHRELDKKLGLLYAKKTEAGLTLSQAQGSLEDLTAQLTQAKERLDNQEDLIKDYTDKRKRLSAELEALTEEKQEAQNKLGGYSKLFETKSTKLEAAKAEYEDARSLYERQKMRFNTLSDIEKNMAGYTNSVKSIITSAKQGRISGIHGTVADIIHVDKKYATAVEIALGASLQNVIVDNEDTAKRCIRHLKETNAGRATFLPLTSIKGNLLNVDGLEDEEGFEGIASNLVSYDEKYAQIVRYILGRTAIIEDIDTATVIAKKFGYKFKSVTLDGQQINAGGSFTGGSVGNAAGIISRKQELDSLEAELQKLSEKMEGSKGGFSELQAEVNKMSIEINGFKEALSHCETEQVRITAEINGVRSLIAQCEESQDNAQLILTRFEKQIEQQKSIITEQTSILSETQKEIERLSDELSKSDERLSAANDERNKASEEISALATHKLTLMKDIESIELVIETEKRAKENIGAGNENLRKEIDELVAKTAQIKEEINEKKELAVKLNSSFSGHKDEIAKINLEIEKLEGRKTELNKEIREKQEDKEKFSNALVVARERKASHERKSEEIKAQLWEKYELAPTEAYAQAHTLDNIMTAKNDLSNLRRKITALGSVNFAAIEEFEEVSERYKTLSGQLGDVEKSKRDLEKLIANLTTDIKARFLSSFNNINEHFQRIFVEIFGGGSARLELTDPDDVLNSSIEIFAAPPGKLIKNLISLSGGEQAMVAITIYFAILLHRPTPFCMLDEVDAPLDEVNVVKYVTYLKRFCTQTQLMVITHRRGTIEGCDVLYGVFMQEKGVSRLLRQEIIDDLDLELD